MVVQVRRLDGMGDILMYVWAVTDWVIIDTAIDSVRDVVVSMIATELG